MIINHKYLGVAVIGPTGSGKTGLAEDLAVRFQGELISVDAKQVYRRMDIGTAKEKQLKVPQHLIDILEPGQKITVAKFKQLADAQIEDCVQRGVLPILVGGSMLYAEAVIDNYQFGGSGLKQKAPNSRWLILGIKWDRAKLKQRLDMRTVEWVEQGLLTEIEGLIQSGVSKEWLESCGQEYRYFTQYLQGKHSLEAAIQLTNISLHQYIKRQYTWWRRRDDVVWVEGLAEAQAIISSLGMG